MTFPLGIFRRYPRRGWRHWRGFAMSIQRHLFRATCGFDESYCSWGYEDSDLGVRAERAGGYFKDGRYSAAVFHLFHDEPNAGEKSNNTSLFEGLLRESDRITPKKSALSRL